MEAFQTIMMIFISLTSACVIFCVIATLLCYLDYVKKKKSYAAEIEHLHEEVRAVRELLRRKESKGNA